MSDDAPPAAEVVVDAAAEVRFRSIQCDLVSETAREMRGREDLRAEKGPFFCFMNMLLLSGSSFVRSGKAHR